MIKRTFTRAVTRDGRPVHGVYLRDGQFHAGFSVNGHWRIRQLKAQDVDDARVERAKLLKTEGAYLSHELRLPPEPRLKKLDELHSDIRKLAQRISRAKLELANRHNRELLADAELHLAKASEAVFSAWRASQL